MKKKNYKKLTFCGLKGNFLNREEENLRNKWKKIWTYIIYFFFFSEK